MKNKFETALLEDALSLSAVVVFVLACLSLPGLG